MTIGGTRRWEGQNRKCFIFANFAFFITVASFVVKPAQITARIGSNAVGRTSVYTSSSNDILAAEPKSISGSIYLF